MAYQGRISSLKDFSVEVLEISELLIGQWQGVGEGHLPDGASFNYHTAIDFSEHQAMPEVLKYEEVAYVRKHNQAEFQHSEVGYLLFSDRGIQWCCVHNNGRMEYLMAIAQLCYSEASTNIVFDSERIWSHPVLEQVHFSRRELIMDSASMKYNQYMTKGDSQLVKHLDISLRRS